MAEPSLGHYAPLSLCFPAICSYTSFWSLSDQMTGVSPNDLVTPKAGDAKHGLSAASCLLKRANLDIRWGCSDGT